jgi:hypothetical protein
MLLGALLLAIAPISNAEHAAVRLAAERLIREPAGTRWELQTMMPALRDRVAVFTVKDAKGAEGTVVFEKGRFRSLSQLTERKPLFPPVAPPAAPNRDRTPLALALVAAVLTAAAAFLPRKVQLAMLAAAAALVVTATFRSAVAPATALGARCS